ncbi:MAG: cation diffusion facilitator family transporter [Candidatus Bathyarchaeota archaeon]|nr:cation diffusion facilitator family transporter [Candidatus Bathyarchaeota archaeon]
MTHTHKPRQESTSDIHEYRSVTKNRLALAMSITGAVMVLEVIGSVLTGSLALGSDAGHMSTHLFALAISFTATTIACKEPCHHRTFGFYRVEILAALFNSIFLFAITAYIFYQGIERMLNPQPVMGFEMLIVALVGLLANGLSILILKNSIKTNLNVKGAFLHMFADLASSVAIIFGAIAVSLTGWYVIDPLLGIGISLVIFSWAASLFKEAVNVLLETAPKGMSIDQISTELKDNLPEIAEITDMHIWEITSNMYSFTAHIQIKAAYYPESKKIVEKINRILDEKYGIEHTTIQIEAAS